MLALGLMAVLLMATVVAVGVVQVVAARHVAAAAADLGALAGAAASVRGDDPCAAATDAVAGNDAELAGCRTDGADVVVSAVVRTQPFFGLQWAPRVSARAGPAP